MTETKSQAKSRILDAVQETAADLHRLGLIDKPKQEKVEVLCLPPSDEPCSI